MKHGPLALCALLLFSGGCTNGDAFARAHQSKIAFEPARVSEVSVELVEAELGQDRIDRYRDHHGDARMRDAVVRRLGEAGLMDPTSTFAMHVAVDRFKLRSSSNAFWNGVMAGGDKVAAEIEIRAGDEIIARYAASGESLRGGVIWSSETGRFDNIADAFAKELVAELSP